MFVVACSISWLDREAWVADAILKTVGSAWAPLFSPALKTLLSDLCGSPMAYFQVVRHVVVGNSGLHIKLDSCGGSAKQGARGWGHQVLLPQQFIALFCSSRP